MEIISYIGIDSDERYWIDILIYLDREVSFDKGSFEGVLELYRYIENVFLQSLNNGDIVYDEGGNFLEGVVCQDFFFELFRYVEICCSFGVLKFY